MTTRKIAHYEITDLLGEGGIGQVHAAQDTVLGREVAIKSLRPELLNDSSFVERFRTEATSLARLNHPNITTLYTLLPDGGNLYMVMELVRGRTLEQIITERGTPFGSAEAVAIIGQAADGLSYAHRMGVVHRDIKPANLIITDAGLLKIMDFGIARVQGSQRHTRDGSVVGTLAYMAPEQLRAEEVDARTDLYSLAIVLYEMLTGAVPFSATNDYDLMRAQIHTAPERPTKAVPGIDPQVERALMRALSKKPGDRYASVDEFKQALGNSVSRTEAVSIAHKVTRLASAVQLPPALTTAITEPARKFSPALRGVAIGAAAALVVAAAVVLLIGPRPTSQTASVPPTAAPPAAAPSVQQTSTAPKSPPAPTAAAHPMFPGARPSQTAASPPAPPPPPAAGSTMSPARSDGNRPPFPVAAEPSVARPAAQVAEATPGQPTAQVAMATPSVTTNPSTSRSMAPPPETRPAPRAAAVEAADQPPTTPPAATEKAPAAAPVAVTEKAAAAETTAAPVSADQPGTAVAAAQAAVHPAAAGEETRPVPAAPQPSEEPAGSPAAPAPAAAVVPSAAPAVAPVAPTAPAAPRVSFAEVKAAYDIKDYPRTRDLAEPMAASGDPDAQFIMGRLHHIGGGMRKDEEKAVQWYQKAADQDHAIAQYALGLMYENGDGVLPNKRTAAEWYRKAATRGVAAAQFNLGVMFARGEGVDKDTGQARRWFTEAANNSNPTIAEQAEAALDSLSGRRRRR